MSKSEEYNRAMSRYHRNPFYHRMGYPIASVIIILQIFTLVNLETGMDFSIWLILLCLVIAYLMTDFVNGLIHMIMDNNTSYTSVIGPFVAAFHLHHRNPKYRTRNIFRVYFEESGSKFWLAVYLPILADLQISDGLPYGLEFVLVSFGILSSVAEVSHYLCHNSTSPRIRLLQKMRFLLPRRHHALHHSRDNMNYGFLNGLTDPVLNVIAATIFSGYKRHADTHWKNYVGPETGNRD